MQFELDIVGYAVVMEFNQNKHIHFHSVFYVNGQKRQKYYPVYVELERAWHELTNGYLYDCQRNNYCINGLKMINHHDHEAFRSTCYMLCYLAKTKQKLISIKKFGLFLLKGKKLMVYLILNEVPK